MNTDPLPVASERVSLRRFRQEDLERFQMYRTDPDVGKYQDWAVMNDNEASQFIHAVSSDTLFTPGEWNQIAISHPVSDQLIGDVGLHIHAEGQTAEIGITLAKEAQGKGLANEALRLGFNLLFENTDAARIFAFALKENHASIRLLQSLNMDEKEPIHSVENGEAFIERQFELTRNSWLSNSIQT